MQKAVPDVRVLGNMGVNQSLISIIMPVYNGASYLMEAIESVISQDYPYWELLIVDNGSSDNSMSIAESFPDTRIKLFSEPNKGVSKARNMALKHMKGDFFCFLDADDVLTRTSLSSRLASFGDEDICFSDGSVEVYDSFLSIKERTWTCQQPKHVLGSLIRLDGACFFGPTWMIRRKPSVKYFFDEELTHGEELFFYMSYAHLGRYVCTNKIVLKYRRSANSMMSDVIGLARGYSLIGMKIKSLPVKVSPGDRITFAFRSRKIIFLSLVRRRRFQLALRYLLSGSI